MIFTEFHCKIDYDFCMIWMWLILLIILNTFWLGLVLVGPPEKRLMILPALLFACWQSDAPIFSMVTLVVLCVLGLAGELFEFAAGTVGSKKAGGKIWDRSSLFWAGTQARF